MRDRMMWTRASGMRERELLGCPVALAMDVWSFDYCFSSFSFLSGGSSSLPPYSIDGAFCHHNNKSAASATAWGSSYGHFYIFHGNDYQTNNADFCYDSNDFCDLKSLFVIRELFLIWCDFSSFCYSAWTSMIFVILVIWRGFLWFWRFWWFAVDVCDLSDFGDLVWMLVILVADGEKTRNMCRPRISDRERQSRVTCLSLWDYFGYEGGCGWPLCHFGVNLDIWCVYVQAWRGRFRFGARPLAYF